MKIITIPASAAFGEGFEGEAYRLEGDDTEILSRARAMGWHGEKSPLHTSMADIAKRVRSDCSEVGPEVRAAITRAERLQEKNKGRPFEGRLVSHLERNGDAFTRVFTMQNGKGPARVAGFDTDGLRWTTTCPTVALKLVKHYAESPELATEIRVAAAALAPKVAETIPAAAEANSLPPILKPTGQPVSDIVCGLSLEGDVIVADYPARDQFFYAAIRAARFRWSGSRWQRAVTGFQGGPVDRVAEVAQGLIEAGFLVRIHHAGALAKAVSGDYAPEQTRWVSVASGMGDYDGWYALTWLYGDDMYGVAKALPGARWVNPMLLVPPGAHASVVDFAARYDFRTTPEAEKVADVQRAAVLGGVTVIPKAAKPRPGPQAGMPVMATTGTGIDDELLDDAAGELGYVPAHEPQAVSKEPGDAIKAIFGTVGCHRQDLAELAEVAGAWHLAKFLEISSTHYPDVFCPPTARVITPGGEWVCVTEYLEQGCSFDGRLETSTCLAPVFPPETGFRTFVTEFHKSDGEARSAIISLDADGNARNPWSLDAADWEAA